MMILRSNFPRVFFRNSAATQRAWGQAWLALAGLLLVIVPAAGQQPASQQAASEFKDACPESVPLTPPGRLQAMALFRFAFRVTPPQ